jgi:8-oxo-dGTP diphosphatase
METRKVSGIVFYDEQKRILLQDRRGISKWGEEWAFFGGKVEDNETPEQAVVRETKEELSFDLVEYKKIGVHVYDLEELHVIDTTYVSPLKNHLSQFVQREGQGMKLFTISETRKLKLIQGDYEVLDMLEEFFKKI